jgi:hypothetical protein
MYTFANTGAIKIIENNLGHRWVKMLLTTVIQGPPGPPQIAIPPDILEAMREEIEEDRKKKRGRQTH